MIDDGFLGDDPTQALTQFVRVFTDELLPFLGNWWAGAAPIPDSTEVKALREGIQERASKLPVNGCYRGFPELLSRLSEGIRFNRRNYINIHPSPFLPSVLASLAVAIQNPNNIVEEVSQPTWKMEAEAIDWLATNLFGIAPGQAWGNVVSGGTIANMTALLVARDYAYDKLSRPKAGRPGPRGVIGQKPGIVLATKASHYSLMKTLWYLGLGHENLVTVPVCWDEEIRANSGRDDRFIKGMRSEWRGQIMDAIALDSKEGAMELERFYSGAQCPFSLQPLGSEILKTLYSCFEYDTPLIACVLSFGTTDTGTIEHVGNAAIDILHQEDVFIHVDAAFGGFAGLVPDVRKKMGSIEYVDSFTVDGHKLGFLHYPCGAVIFKDQCFLHQIHHEAPYLGPLAPTLEGSRSGASSAALWLAQKTIGIDGYQSAISRLIDFTAHLKRAFARDGLFQVLHRVDLNAIAVAPLPRGNETRTDANALARDIRDQVLRGGRYLINYDRSLAGVRVRNIPTDPDSKLVDIEALRIVISNPLVTIDDADNLATLLGEYLEIARHRRTSSGH